VAFVNARTDEDRANFFSRFGLLTGSEIDPDEVVQSQGDLRTLLAIAGGDDSVARIQSVNAALGQHKSFYLQPSLNLGAAGGAPQMLLKPQTLFGLMLMETAMVALHGARFATCQHCTEIFLTGPLTWRRAHAHYCSDRCRVAAMRRRNAGRGTKRIKGDKHVSPQT
jgi:hypothetical protein